MISEELNKQIRFEFGKNFEQMSDEEKNNITSIVLRKNDLTGKETNMSVSELRNFLGLTKCVISDFEISDDDMQILSVMPKLEVIQFSECNFKNSQKPFSNSNLKLLIIDNCSGNIVSLFTENENLEKLRVVGQNEFDASLLARCNNLLDIFLQKTEVKKLEAISNLKNVRRLNLDGSIFNFSALDIISSQNSDITIEYEENAIPER
jgi:hypothetical protein